MRGLAGSPPALAVDRLVAGYPGREVLHGVSFSVGRGEFLALAGPNGSGKTTLIRAILGLIAPRQGGIHLEGNDLPKLTIRERARLVSWVPQDETSGDNVPVGAYVLLGRYPHLARWGTETIEDREAARSALEAVGLADRATSGIHELSGGERQRVLLARALAQATPLLLLDEPTAHLDIAYQMDILERVRALCRAGGKTVIAAMHDLNLATRFADRIAVLSRGRLIANGPSHEVLSEALLNAVWGVTADLRTDPRTGVPYLIPRMQAPPRPVAGHAGEPLAIHVVGGGGAAAPFLRTLLDEGYRLSTGALHLLDSDAELAAELGIPFAAEVPFAPLGEEVRARNRDLLDRAQVIVVSPFAVGPSNLANLDDLRPYVGRVPVFLVQADRASERDFANGRAVAALRDLEQAGGQLVPSISELVERLRRIAAAPGLSLAARTASTTPS
jgi:iron complex transport system ATP-binding protein